MENSAVTWVPVSKREESPVTDEPTIVAAVVTGPEGVLLGRRRDGNLEWT
jgi:hypothetical protein